MSGKKEPEVIVPHAYATRMQPIVDRCTRKVGVLGLVGDDGRLCGKGTAFFTEKGDLRLICTARHVVREEKDEVAPVDWPFTKNRLRVLVFKDAADLRAVTIPAGFEIGEDDLIWEDVGLDVAVFNAPADLVSSGLVEFSSASDDARVAKKVRERWATANTDKQSLATFVLGFPNITHYVDAPTATEWLGLVPMPGYITALDRDSYDGPSTRAAQMMVELDPGVSTAVVPEPFHKAATEWRERLLAPVPEKVRPPLGGFSGAPLFFAHQDGEAIIAVMKQGAPQFEARILAAMSCWDEILSEIERQSDAG